MHTIYLCRPSSVFSRTFLQYYEYNSALSASQEDSKYTKQDNLPSTKRLSLPYNLSSNLSFYANCLMQTKSVTCVLKYFATMSGHINAMTMTYIKHINHLNNW